jgi:hypothetical protein
VLELPASLQVLGELPIAGLATLLYVAEFVADKLPAFVALSVHGLESGARLAVNTSPEPFSNFSLSLAEEVSFAGLVYLVIQHPVAALAVALALLAIGLVAMVWIARALGRLMRRLARAA